MTSSRDPDEGPPETRDPDDRDPAGSGEDTADEGGEGRVPRPIPVQKPRPAHGQPTMPKPVRAGLRPEADSGDGLPEPAEAEVEVEDGTLTVRVRGRSRGRTSEGAADLLLLGFYRPGDEAPVREALVVGRALEALSPDQLHDAWAKGREPRDPFAPTELFPGTSRKRGRGR